MTDQQLQELFINEFPSSMPITEVINKFDNMPESQNKRFLRLQYCNWLVTVLTKNYIKYDFDQIDIKDIGIQSFLKNAVELDKQEYFYWAFFHFLKGEYALCKQQIHALLQSLDFSEEPFGETDFADLLIVPFKNGFEGFWAFVASEIKCVESKKGVVELCSVIDLYYNSISNEEILQALQKYIQNHPTSGIATELLGFTYYSMSMWNNAIAYLERIDTSVFFYPDEIYWMLAWSYGKIKNYVDEENCYRKCIEIYPDREFLLNNLGYCLLKQKKYGEAEKLFKKCIEQHIDLPYAANNYIRVLIATGRNTDAKNFVKNADCPISKTLKDKVSKLPLTNTPLKKNVPVIEVAQDDDHTKVIAQSIGIKRQQFSSEKLLEDELTARLEAGVPVFDLNLKIYRRRGEYGRQYIIPVGRLDLLCEDDNGYLYIIELKKDSGYDDAYKQTAEYLEWFENSEKFKGKRVYGIICLNNPTQELISKVHSDKRMKLYEYSISYTER